MNKILIFPQTINKQVYGVIQVGIFNAFFEWQAARYDKKVEKMREHGLCPDCNGRGYDISMANAYIYTPNIDYNCTSCSGSGSFSDWENVTQ